MTETGISEEGSERLADRYEVHETLGRGGMACVYRATDLSNGCEVALKQLLLPEAADQRAAVSALFEREYHTLAQLRHPRVIAVYDYGVSATSGPYYTMELLDGGDLRDRAPIAWREICAYAFDVCSSLALLHSRRLLHRDVSPRNVRCARDGKAKLIDFGAVAPMGSGAGTVVGTPAFIAPETLHRSTVDARTDLFSLGATIYYALTGTVPYAARTFGELFSAWAVRPLAPSARVPGIPPELDDLVLALLQIEPTLRPQSAFDVMQRLAAIAGLDASESEGVSRAYLATPLLVAREPLLVRLRHELESARLRRGSGLLIRAPAGLGRSRVLDACALEAKTHGATVLRATARASLEPLGVGLALLAHLLEALPNLEMARRFPELFERSPHEPAAAPRLRSSAELRTGSDRVVRSLSRFLVAVSRRYPLLIAVDDVHSIDETSAALLSELLDHVRRGRLTVVLTAVSDPHGPSQGLEALARRCRELDLPPLTRDETKQLLTSLFGDVPHVEMLTGEIFDIARGNPRHCMELAQHLVDNAAITYSSGTWTLPIALTERELPRSAEDAIAARIAALSPDARFIAESHALAFAEPFTNADYRRLCPALDVAHLQAALAELVSQQALVIYGQSHALANRLWSVVLRRGLTAADAKQRHGALAEVYRAGSDIALAHHLFAAGLEEEGLHVVAERQNRNQYAKEHNEALENNVGRLAPVYFASIALAKRLGRSPREVAELQRWSTAVSVAANGAHYHDAAPGWLAQLVHDSGLDLWREDRAETDPQQRLMRALTRAQERYLATPEAERVYSIEEALRRLAEFVAISIAIGARSLNAPLLASLPGLLEPFAPLSPVLDAIWQNAIATNEFSIGCQYEVAQARWLGVYEKLSNMQGGELTHSEVIKNAVAHALGVIGAQIGSASAVAWADTLDKDPYQRVSALYLRKLVRLEQGDWIGAERYGRQAELLALQSNAPEMFPLLLTLEIETHAHARDLTGLKDTIARAQLLAAGFPAWTATLRDAEARFELIRGNYVAAKEGFERCLAEFGEDSSGQVPNRTAWLLSTAGLAEALLGLDDAEGARRHTVASLARCTELGIRPASHDLVRLAALAEAKLGDFDSAVARLTEHAERQLALDVSGLKLGLTYEARAQVAIWAGDQAAWDTYAKLTAREYRHGAQSPLGARYESLVNEARRRGFQASVQLGDFELTTMMATSGYDIQSVVLSAMQNSIRIEDRTQRALELVCAVSGSRTGHLYLVKPDHVVLASSLGNSPPSGLEAAVQTQVELDRGRSDDLTEMATGLLTSQPVEDHTVVLEGTVYELLLLRCVVGNEGQIAAIAAVCHDGAGLKDPHRPQLLAAVAAQLAQP